MYSEIIFFNDEYKIKYKLHQEVFVLQLMIDKVIQLTPLSKVYTVR